MKYLGIDYGSKRIGLALSDENGVIAFPYEIIAQSPNAIGDIKFLAEKEGVQEIILGESLDLFGKPNDIMSDITRFAAELGRTTDLPVHFEKEFMTSHHAVFPHGKERLHARKLKARASDPVDASAAALILQRFLDKARK